MRQRLAAGGDFAIVEAFARFITTTAILSRQLASMMASQRQIGTPPTVSVLDAMQRLVDMIDKQSRQMLGRSIFGQDPHVAAISIAETAASMSEGVVHVGKSWQDQIEQRDREVFTVYVSEHIVGFSYDAFRDAVPSITFTGDSEALWDVCNAYQSSVWPEWLESIVPEVLRYRKRLEDACKTGKVRFSKIAEIPAEVLTLAGENGIGIEARHIRVRGPMVLGQAMDHRVCKRCGCTDSDCSQCIEKTGEPCHWVTDDLCSACIE